MEATAIPAPELGALLEPLTGLANSHQGRVIVVKDSTSAGTWSGPTVDYGLGATGPKQLLDTVWSAKYAGLYFFNRSPWVEHDYCGPVDDVRLLGPNDAIPAGAWIAELLDASDQPGAIGYHEGQALEGHLAGHTVVSTHVSKVGAAGVHTERVILRHDATGTEVVLMKSFIKTAREDSVYSTEVITHELYEALVDPYVNNESEIRVYTNPADGKEYIGEVGDPVQSRAIDVGAPEGRPCGVPEAYVSDFAYPAWWAQPQTRAGTCFTLDATLWGTLPGLPDVPAFTVAAGGYMQFRSPGGEWEQAQGEHAPKGANKE